MSAEGGMRRRWPALVVMAVASLLAATAEGQRLPRRVALDWLALDGEGLASMALGIDEAQVKALLGEPDTVTGSAVAERRLGYEVAPGVRLEVHVRERRVHALGLTARGHEAPARSPRTLRGLRLGVPVTAVTERYGESTGGRLWYADVGIAFNLEGPAETVESILVFPPGTPAP